MPDSEKPKLTVCQKLRLECCLILAVIADELRRNKVSNQLAAAQLDAVMAKLEPPE